LDGLDGICAFEQWRGFKIRQYWFLMFVKSEAINDLDNGLATTLPSAPNIENSAWDIIQLAT